VTGLPLVLGPKQPVGKDVRRFLNLGSILQNFI
jgi:hypothetical protein